MGTKGLGPLFAVSCVWLQGPQLRPPSLASVVMFSVHSVQVRGISESEMEAVDMFVSLTTLLVPRYG